MSLAARRSGGTDQLWQDFPFSPNAPLHPDHDEMQRHFQPCAERFDTVRRIRVNGRVVSVRPA